MRFAILSRNSRLYSVRRLVAEALAQQHSVDVLNPMYGQILLGHSPPESPALFWDGERLAHYDVVLPRVGAATTEIGVSLTRQFEIMGMRAINSSRSIAESRNKLWSLQVLAARSIPVPSTVLLSQPAPQPQALIAQLGGLPLVLKRLRGTQGVGVMLVHTLASFASVHETMLSMGQDLLVQEFVNESQGNDLRAFVVGDRVVAAMRRKAQEGEFRANIHRGGRAQAVELSPQESQVALASAKALGLEIAGVDLLLGKSGPLVIEVNSSPGLEGIERATGTNVAAEIIRYAASRSKR